MDLAHYGASDLTGARFAWRLLSDDGTVRAQGDFSAKPLPTGSLSRLGGISVNLCGFPAPEKIRLEVYQQGGGTMNSWDCWVYPSPVVNEPKDVIWASDWTEELAARVAAGERAP